MTGYLTQRGILAMDIIARCSNREIRNIIIERILALFRKAVSGNGELLRSFCNAILSADAEAVERLLIEYMGKTISVRDNFARSLHENFLSWIDDWNSRIQTRLGNLV